MKTVAALAFALMAPLAQREPVPLERLTVPVERLPAESAPAHASSLTKGRRVGLGTVVATVLGQPGACVNAIEAHLSSLKP